jgi:hypothetical protein
LDQDDRVDHARSLTSSHPRQPSNRMTITGLEHDNVRPRGGLDPRLERLGVGLD